jgi:hypothetical protein
MGFWSWLRPGPEQRIERARHLMQHGRFDEARGTLMGIDHPDADRLYDEATRRIAGDARSEQEVRRDRRREQIRERNQRTHDIDLNRCGFDEAAAFLKTQLFGSDAIPVRSISREPAPDLVEVLVFDLRVTKAAVTELGVDEAIVNGAIVTEGRARSWSRDHDELFHVAHANLASTVPDTVETRSCNLGDRHLCEMMLGDSPFVAALFQAQFASTGAAGLLALPSRHCVLFRSLSEPCDAESLAAFCREASRQHRSSDAADALTTSVYWWRPEGWFPLPYHVEDEQTVRVYAPPGLLRE